MLEGGKKLLVCLQVLKWISCFVNKLKIPHHFNLITTNLSLKSLTTKRFRCSDGSNFAYLGVAKEDVQIVNFIGLFVLQVHSTARKVHQVFQNQMMKTIPIHRGRERLYDTLQGYIYLQISESNDENNSHIEDCTRL